MSDYSKRLVNEAVYGVDCLVLDDITIQEFLEWRENLHEGSQVQGVYSDEGLYDFFSGFNDYKRVSKSNAARIIGWPVVNYIIDNKADDPFYQMDMLDDDWKGRANTVSHGGTVLTGDSSLKSGDYKWMKQMEGVIDALGWEVIDWIGCGVDRKSQVVVIPTKDQKVNEAIKIQIKEEFGAPPGMLPSPSRKGVKKAKKRKDRSIYTEKEEYTFGPDWMPTSLAQRKKMKRIHRKSSRYIREQENNIKKLVAVYPGRFQPFGPHHKATYEFLKKRFDEVFIVTSNKQGGSRHPMSFSQKKKHMMKMGIPSKAIVQEKQPYIPKGLLSKYDGDTTAVVFAVGAKDEGRLSSGKYFKKYRKNYMRLKGYKEHGYTLQAPHISVKVGGQEVSGTTMRMLLGSDKYDVDLKKKFFKKMFGYFDQKTFDLFTSSFTEAARKPRKKGQHRNSPSHSDLYTDENPVGTIKGLKFATVKDAKASVNKIKRSGKSHAHKIQAAVAMEQRAKEMGKKSAAGVYRSFINKMKEKTKKKNESIIIEGGAYGHMAHPFDDYALTFGELKDIIDLGLQGKLDKEEAVTEKLDGQNIMISAIKGKAVAARNKGDLKRGGMSLKGVQAKFANHIPSVRDAFVFSMRDIANAVEKMSKKDQITLFNDGKNWANIEIIYPENLNVIDYDGPATIVFHGILKYNQAWTPSGEVKSGGKRIADIINKVNKGIQTKFAFKGPNIIKLHKPKNYGRLRQKYIGSLNKLQNIYRLKDSDELSLYHQHFWLEYILNGANSTDYKNIPDNVLYPLMKRWAFSDKSYKMTEINKLKEDHPKFVEWVRATEKMDHGKMLKDNMKPFEEIFFGVGAEILDNASNYLSANPDKTSKKLRDDLNKAVRSLNSKKDFSNIGKLKAQLKKLKSMPSITKAAPSEGLVFKYKGKVYKFTGFFAPINQILGLEKFSR